METNKIVLVSCCFVGAFLVIKHLKSYEESLEVKAMEECKEYIPETVKLLNDEWPLKNDKPRTMMLQQSSSDLPRSFVLLQTKSPSNMESIMTFISNVVYGQNSANHLNKQETKVIAHVAIELDYNLNDLNGNDDDDDDDKAMIYRLITHPKHRGKGYAKSMMAVSTLFLGSINYSSTMLMCKPSLVSFYKNMGGVVQKNKSVRQSTTDRTTLRFNINDKLIKQFIDYLPNNSQTFDQWRNIGQKLLKQKK